MGKPSLCTAYDRCVAEESTPLRVTWIVLSFIAFAALFCLIFVGGVFTAIFGYPQPLACGTSSSSANANGKNATKVASSPFAEYRSKSLDTTKELITQAAWSDWSPCGVDNTKYRLRRLPPGYYVWEPTAKFVAMLSENETC